MRGILGMAKIFITMQNFAPVVHIFSSIHALRKCDKNLTPFLICAKKFARRNYGTVLLKICPNVALLCGILRWKLHLINGN